MQKFHGVALALGDGLTVPDVASTVAVGCEWPIDKSVLVTVHSHPSLVVHWTKKVDGDGTVATYAHTTTVAGETETHDAANNPRSTSRELKVSPARATMRAWMPRPPILLSNDCSAASWRS